jgi:hypothetical protein
VVQSIVDALKSNESNGLSKSLPAVFFWCVGLGIQGVTDCGVEGIDGKNKEVMYQAHAGKPKTLSSLLGEMGEKDQSADQMIYSELTTLVPQAYLGEC